MDADLLAKSGEAMKSGPIGLAVILILCIACYFLFKSMSKHLKTVREDFPNDRDAAGRAGSPTTSEGDAAEPTAEQPAAEQPVVPETDQRPAEPPSS